MKRLRIVLLGCGTVGGGFLRLLAQERLRIRSRYGFDPEIARVLVRDGARRREHVPPPILTTSPLEALDTPADLVVELMGGVHTAGTLVRRALARGQHVVTANKALLAASGDELFTMAAASGAALGFEASVCGGIPVVRTLQHGLAGDTIDSISGIVNGTCNFVLTRMEQGWPLEDALRQAQDLGFAESDPSLDLSGEDAAQKMTILAQLALEGPIRRRRWSGISGIGPADIRVARERGTVLRLVATARSAPGGAEVDVRTRALAANDKLARVTGEENAVVIRGRSAGEIVLTGRGAGALPTATAVLSDVVWAAGRALRGTSAAA